MLTRWRDVDRMLGAMGLLQNRMDRVFSEYGLPYGYRWGREAGVDILPRTNLYDTGEGFEILAEVPGFAKEDLNVKIQGNYLEISGNRKSDAPEGYSTHRTERGTASFSRSFTLPADVEGGKVNASLKDGILKLSLPKAEAAKPRQIAIK
ncbi:MAG: Hsp20/alpha crystallin family protein [Proteobacteria bacterium]|nr:Hsp20/alpha crystallin family protein [Pseudomonadota bacterium]MBU1738673.1 Hsp20/alpha crystallin family protein [Pseudomonadota bacterium]